MATATATSAEASARPRRNLHRRTRSTNSVDPTLLAELRASKEAPKDVLGELHRKRASVTSLPSSGYTPGRRSMEERPSFQSWSMPSSSSSSSSNDAPPAEKPSMKRVVLVAPASSSALSPPLSLTSAAAAAPVSSIDGGDPASSSALPTTASSLRLPPPAIPNRPWTRMPLRGRKLRLDPINNCVRLNNIEGEIRLRSPVMEVDESDLEDDYSMLNHSAVPPLDDQEACSLGSSHSQRSSRDSSLLPSPSPSQPYLPICPPLSHQSPRDDAGMVGVPVTEDDMSLKGIGIDLGIELEPPHAAKKDEARTGTPAAIIDAGHEVDYRKTQVIERPPRSTAGGLRWDIWRLCWQA
ncbi:hypothetical protein SYNPS1DRAFT_29051 [Syncephalis pseudoplumigaleata]|uniref:Uncharacterized protein n=1 Tax=Syncephalis pseudoplumigaleata TaxID=1712513 RepID=A0A4P9Z0J2_9FUNG|nr:hypothetical protein SYNPS1DRAFT_29051 [Syncephalis pseudoplumigaleata]|eukprot:RKP25211.1 hypothetical protein SYNPS1DRAFT_29051 [Syncephalis pseudoplumigaleata]